MRKLIAETGKNARNEDWYYIEYDEKTSQVFYVHAWNHMDSKLNVSDGEQRTLLCEAGDKAYYADAIEALKKGFA
ncbi:hypothetical protein JQR88_11105 [Pseudomonas luteola]|uniref:hypothetical protein n=1 Tax=Pseudomonas luteola TaxID=47886 RepID=UPI003DA19BF3